MYPAHSAAEATGALELIVPAAIILDLVLAGAAEWDLLIRLKRDERTRQIPVVIVSALGEHEKGLTLGADAYLVKPVERRTLVDTLSGLRARQHPTVRARQQ